MGMPVLNYFDNADMKIINNINDIELKKNTAITIGKFEALHKGHQKLIEKVVSYGRYGLVPTVLTFKNASVSIEKHDDTSKFLDEKLRHEFLERLGIELLIEIEFTKEFANILPEAFVKEILIDKLCASEIITGTNFRFGKDRAGDTTLLSVLSEKYEYNYHAIDLEKYGDIDISTTYAKKLLSDNDYDTLRNVLGDKYPVYFGR